MARRRGSFASRATRHTVSRAIGAGQLGAGVAYHLYARHLLRHGGTRIMTGLLAKRAVPGLVRYGTVAAGMNPYARAGMIAGGIASSVAGGLLLRHGYSSIGKGALRLWHGPRYGRVGSGGRGGARAGHPFYGNQYSRGGGRSSPRRRSRR